MRYQRVILSGRMQCDEDVATRFEGALNEFFSLRSMPIAGAEVFLIGSRFEGVKDGELTFLVDADIRETTEVLRAPLESTLVVELSGALVELAQSQALFAGTAKAVASLTFKTEYATPSLFWLDSSE